MHTLEQYSLGVQKAVVILEEMGYSVAKQEILVYGVPALLLRGVVEYKWRLGREVVIEVHSSAECYKNIDFKFPIIINGRVEMMVDVIHTLHHRMSLGPFSVSMMNNVPVLTLGAIRHDLRKTISSGRLHQATADQLELYIKAIDAFLMGS